MQQLYRELEPFLPQRPQGAPLSSTENEVLGERTQLTLDQTIVVSKHAIFPDWVVKSRFLDTQTLEILAVQAHRGPGTTTIFFQMVETGECQWLHTPDDLDITCGVVNGKVAAIQIPNHRLLFPLSFDFKDYSNDPDVMYLKFTNQKVNYGETIDLDFEGVNFMLDYDSDLDEDPRHVTGLESIQFTRFFCVEDVKKIYGN